MPAPTTDPFRLRLMKGLTQVLQQIATANGYYTEAGVAVYRGRMTFGSTDPLPCIAIMEPPLQPEPVHNPLGSGARRYQYDLYVQGFAVDDAKNPSDPAHLLLADIRKAVISEWSRVQKIPAQRPDELLFGVPRRRIQALDTDGGLVRPSDDISSKAYCYLLLRFTIAEDWANPES